MADRDDVALERRNDRTVTTTLELARWVIEHSDNGQARAAAHAIILKALQDG